MHRSQEPALAPRPAVSGSANPPHMRSSRPAMRVTYLFEARSMKLFLINAGYHAVSFIIMGAILGAWK